MSLMVLASWATLWIWAVLTLASLLYLVFDFRKHNSHLSPLMRWVWYLTIVYSGPLGLAIYFYSGRRQISDDSVWRKGFRSVAHCYSRCGAGEIAGVFIAAGILALDDIYVASLSFILAYVAGFALTVGPLMQEGVLFWQAFKDAFYSETASITVMEVVAIGTDLLLAGESTMQEPLFWTSLIFSLSLGIIAAYPVNVLLIRLGIKKGMHDPRDH